jgi:hypothetical protein
MLAITEFRIYRKDSINRLQILRDCAETPEGRKVK